MKNILLMRHAKSSWEDSSLRDMDRPLNKRGRNDAPLMAEYLKRMGYLPNRIVASPAKRVEQTLEPLTGLIENAVAPIMDEQLYFGWAEDYLDVIRSTPNEVDRIMLIGHNPMTEELVGKLSGENKRPAKMPTAAIACFEYNSDNWASLESNDVSLKWLMTPKKLKKLS